MLTPCVSVVGHGRIELPTSCLSSMHSKPTELMSHLSRKTYAIKDRWFFGAELTAPENYSYTK